MLWVSYYTPSYWPRCWAKLKKGDDRFQICYSLKAQKSVNFMIQFPFECRMLSGIYMCFPSFHFVIGPENPRHFLNQSNANLAVTLVLLLNNDEGILHSKCYKHRTVFFNFMTRFFFPRCLLETTGLMISAADRTASATSDSCFFTSAALPIFLPP